MKAREGDGVLEGSRGAEETRRGCEYCAVNSVCGKVCLQLHSDAPDPEQRASRGPAPNEACEPRKPTGPTATRTNGRNAGLAERSLMRRRAHGLEAVREEAARRPQRP